MRRPLYIANWKMNKTDQEARSYVGELLPLATELTGAADVVLAPPFTSLGSVSLLLAGSGVGLAAQDLHWESHGAFTGEVSGPMLAALGVRYALVGHSERRSLFGESDDQVALKARAARQAGITPIICLGETERQRESGSTKNVIELQLRKALDGLKVSSGADLVVAYEPVWAIGTGRTATHEQIAEAHAFLRGVLAEAAGDRCASETRILYGGSVKRDGIEPIAAEPDVDGCLVGGASLEAGQFAGLVREGARAAAP